MREIPGFPGYYADAFGTVYSARDGRRSPENSLMVLKSYPHNRGYRFVSLYVDKQYKRLYVHRAVALAFLPNPEGKPEVNHLDGNKANNAATNLAWATGSENRAHGFKIGLENWQGEKHPRSRLKDQDIAVIHQLHREGKSNSEIGRMFGVGQPHICKILKGKRRAQD